MNAEGTHKKRGRNSWNARTFTLCDELIGCGTGVLFLFIVSVSFLVPFFDVLGKIAFGMPTVVVRRTTVLEWNVGLDGG